MTPRRRKKPAAAAVPLYTTEPSTPDEYSDPLPKLGARLPPEMLRDLMLAPPIMTLAQAAPYLALSVSRVRRLVAHGDIVGVSGQRDGTARAVVPRSSVIAYWERRCS